MQRTRSSARLSAKAPQEDGQAVEQTPASGGQGKRKSSVSAPAPSRNKKAKASAPAPAAPSSVVGPSSSSGDQSSSDKPIDAVLSFDFEEAMKHLVDADSRFQDLFDKVPCGPFEHLEQLHPFRALCISILGQQISWKAARSITHKFIRLYNPSIPEEVTDETRSAAMEVFPYPEQVSKTEVPLLRTAGLSERKAQYIQDLAARFADGRLSTEKLLKANDEELAEMLIGVKGIGRWTVDMFAIFSLRRPDILPVGDLGVQRGMARWFLALYSPKHPYNISPEKIDPATPQKRMERAAKAEQLGTTLPTLDGGEAAAIGGVNRDSNAMTSETVSLLPQPFTPSIKRTLEKTPTKAVSLPPGMTTAILKGRLEGKKVKGAFLTPQEMSDLTQSWRPFRSLGVYYMWSLAEAPAK